MAKANFYLLQIFLVLKDVFLTPGTCYYSCLNTWHIFHRPLPQGLSDSRFVCDPFCVGSLQVP